MARKVDLVPMQEACKLWRKSAKTLKKWAQLGIVLYDIIKYDESLREQWYIETPNGRYNRTHKSR